LEVLAEPLAYGHALRVELELASELLGSDRPDFQQVRWEAGEYFRLWSQTQLQLRVFGGWSAGPIPLQRKLSLAGVDTVRGYPYRLRFLGDRMLGGSLLFRFPVLRDVRLDDPWRFLGLRSVHLAPFVDGGWVWDRHEDLGDVSPRAGAGLRLIAGFAFASVQRFEIAVDVAHPLDALGRREDEGPQVWIRLQTTAGGGTY
jgi:hemolysin activation/secretion protein